MKTPEKTIQAILKVHKEQLGEDYRAYLNHCQRVYYYAITLLLMKEDRKLAISAAFHDLNIWLGDTMDYLKGSAELATSYISKNQLDYLPDEVAFIISNHHKIRPIKGNIEAEAFRKADLIDLTAGWVRYNIPRSLIIEIERKFPRHQFTRRVMAKVLSRSVSHPLKPFPMMKW